MTESSSARAVPGPPRPAPGYAAPVTDSAAPGKTEGSGGRPPEKAPFADLEDRPVAEHVAVFDAEHARLQRELGTIDQP